jgi:glycerophosphoryl diester phosphodiesterase
MIVIAHRGSSQLAPENTLPAIKQALLDGVDAIEIDVQLTKDQKVIVLHDEWLNRTTTGSGFVFNTPYSTIRRLDAGIWFHRRFKGTHVPLLEEVLQLLKDQRVTLHIELKNNFIDYPGLEQKVVRLVRAYQMEERVILSSFRQDSLETCLYTAPTIRRGLLWWGNLTPVITNSLWRKLQLYSIHPAVSFLTPEISLIQKEGIRIFPYVVERKSQFELCRRLKADGLFTSSPRQIRKMLKQSR